MLDRLDCAALGFYDTGNSPRFVRGQLTRRHRPSYCPERVSHISRRLDCRQIEHDRAPLADRDKPLDAETHGGWIAAPKFGPAYKAAFDAIYPTLAAKHKIPRYPFFLQGVFGHPRLMLSDGKHPNAAGVQRIVAGILAIVERDLMGARSRHSTEVSFR